MGEQLFKPGWRAPPGKAASSNSTCLAFMQAAAQVLVWFQSPTRDWNPMGFKTTEESNRLSPDWACISTVIIQSCLTLDEIVPTSVTSPPSTP
eukprot:1908609-Heterocapsa_arctica.AAC.1